MFSKDQLDSVHACIAHVKGYFCELATVELDSDRDISHNHKGGEIHLLCLCQQVRDGHDTVYS